MVENYLRRYRQFLRNTGVDEYVGSSRLQVEKKILLTNKLLNSSDSMGYRYSISRIIKCSTKMGVPYNVYGF